MTWNLLSPLFLLGLLLEWGWGEVKVWKVGRGGLSWTSQARSSVGIELEGEAIRPRRISAQENICLVLEWQDGPPEDFRVGGEAHIWDNSAAKASDKVLVDGIDTTSTKDRFRKEVSQAGRAFFLDLGAAYPVSRITFYPPPGEEDYLIKAFEVYLNDGETFDDIGQPVFKLLKRVEVNLEPLVDITFPTELVRFIQLRTLSRDAFELAEVEVYGEGFVPNASYTSELHEFEGPVNFGDLILTTTRLHGPSKGEAFALFQVRSGADDTPLTYYRRDPETRLEEEVSEKEYYKLPMRERGAVREDTENWSPWSIPIRVDSTGRFVFPLDLPSPRRFLQFRITFRGTVDEAMRINDLSVTYSPPLADRAVGEVALLGVPEPPNGVTTVPVGVETTFTCDIRAEFRTQGLEGFDGVRISAPYPPRFVRLEMGDPSEEVGYDSLRVDSTGFTVYFPKVTGEGGGPIRVVFRTMVLMYSTTIRGWLVSLEGSLPQPILPGDATPKVNTNSLQVFGAEMRPSARMTLPFPMLTPNGDGWNDELEISYILAQFADDVHVKVGLYDLSGRKVRKLFSGRLSSGRYKLLWDGRDDDGKLVQPGIYLCRMLVEADAGKLYQSRCVAVVY